MASYDDTATVSGSVVGFSNGADSVPLKNWLVTLPASLDGYTEVNGVRTGKNLFDKDNADIVNGYIDVSSFNVNNNRAKTIYIPIKGGATYTVSKTVGARFSIATASVIPSSGAVYTSRQAGNTSASLTITASSNDKYLWAWVFLEGADTGTLADMLASIQIEVGSTATAYEPYAAPTTYTASLGRTIYGGTADIVTGEGEATGKMVKLNSFNWSYNDTAYAYGFFDSGSNVADMTENKDFQATGYVNNGNPRSALADGEIGVYNTAGYIKRIVIRDDSCTTLEQFLAKITDYDFVYESTTGTDFTFTPITPTPETAKGSNTFWSDQGNTELTYYKDGYGFTSVTVHKETPEGEPVEHTAKLHKIVYGGLIDVIQGKAEPKNLIPFEPISEYTYLGITYTQYSDGTVKINGTASGGLSFYRVIPNGSDGVHFKSGVAYTLSGCVGGSSTTYQLDLRVGNSVVGYYKNAIDYGRGYTFTATEDSVAYPLICVRNGTTVNNVIISPMVEVGSSASEYVPHFEPFSFPPISMETDEGENTLYADQGDSAITYRKEI